MREAWAVSDLPWRAPLEALREYCGEQQAFYFAFQGFATLWMSAPAVVGLAVFAGGALRRQRRCAGEMAIGECNRAATATLMGCQPATYATGMSIHATASSCSSASLPAGSGSMCFHLVMRNSSFLSASLLSV